MDDGRYVTLTTIKKYYDVSSNSLRDWSIKGKIRSLRPNGTKRIYNFKDVQEFFGNKPTKTRKTICYARVSSNHQKEDLQRQIEFLKAAYPEAEIIHDIGSGLNWKRPGFTAILDRCYKGDVEEVVVSYKDRLCRFGNELVEWIFEKTNVKLVVLNKCTSEKDPTRELSEDLLAITTVFVARNNGLRSGLYKKTRKEQEKTRGYIEEDTKRNSR
ncbi:putative resolvase [Gammaproteobacteria bacterium]